MLTTAAYGVSYDPLMNAVEHVTAMLSRCGTPAGVMPPTALFNEGWMLRLVLHWASHHPTSIEPLTFVEGSRWYSEALLPSRFRPRHRGDEAGEGHTHADGVIGHFQLRGSRGDIELLTDARQLTVIEAKMASGLSGGTTRAKDFNQAARNVACIAHLVSSAAIPAVQMTRIGFVLLAPRARIDAGVFGAMEKAAICEAVARRAEQFDADAVAWRQASFDTLMPSCTISALPWESVVTDIQAIDPSFGETLMDFYLKCLQHNPLRAATGRDR